MMDSMLEHQFSELERYFGSQVQGIRLKANATMKVMNVEQSKSSLDNKTSAGAILPGRHHHAHDMSLLTERGCHSE